MGDAEPDIGNAIETVSHAAVWLGLLTHPYDPQAELVKPFVGDWAGVRAAADVLRNVGTAAYAVANNVRWASQGAERVWRGNAGAAAAAHLVALAEPLDEVSAPLHHLADAYERASAEMVALRDAAVNVLNQVGDAAIQAAASAGFAAGRRPPARHRPARRARAAADRPGEPPMTRLEDLAAAARGTRWEALAADEAGMERALVDAMAASADPITAEIGSGLADGSLTWRNIATCSAYADFLNRGLDALRDFEQVVAALAPERPAVPEEEDDGPVWTGFAGQVR